MPRFYPKFLNLLPTFTGFLLLIHGFHVILSSIVFWANYHICFPDSESALPIILSSSFFLFFFSAPLLYVIAIWFTALLVKQLFRAPIYLDYYETKFPRLVAALIYFPIAMVLAGRMYIIYLIWNFFITCIYLSLLFSFGIYLISHVLYKKDS